MTLINANIKDIKPNPKNPRVIKDEKYAKLKKSIEEFPEMLEKRPLVCYTDVDGKYVVLGGNMRLKASNELKLKTLPIVLADDWTAEQRDEFLIKDNVGFGEWDWEQLANEWDAEKLTDWGVDIPGFEETNLEAENNIDKIQNKKLSERFIIPPFSVLDTKQGIWQQRKNYWLSLGIKSEIGRNSMALNFSGSKNSDIVNGNNVNWSNNTKLMVQKIAGENNGVSIFDPVLCELSYKWFNIPNGKILDPFAGGSVRGIVSAKLGYEYFGNDLRKEQIESNRLNAKEVLQESEIYPTWTCGDSLDIDIIAKDYKADLIFSCPPYADLEVYSDKKEDLSNMEYDKFIKTYREIIQKCCEKLNNDRFAVFVVGDVRNKKGFYYNFVSDTIKAFLDNNCFLYNEMILLNSVGNAGMRASKTFNGGRKVVKVHQNVLVFYKGNPKKIKINYPLLDLNYINNESD